jgi:nucleosome binding factor SPN SPT16 subunit
MQQRKASDNNIDLSTDFTNIVGEQNGLEIASFNPIVKTDKQRVMQVLLSL